MVGEAGQGWGVHRPVEDGLPSRVGRGALSVSRGGGAGVCAGCGGARGGAPVGVAPAWRGPCGFGVARCARGGRGVPALFPELATKLVRLERLCTAPTAEGWASGGVIAQSGKLTGVEGTCKVLSGG